MPKQVNFRLPDDCVDFLGRQASRDASSQTSVIVRAIRAYRDHQTAKSEGASAPTPAPSNATD